ncbi:BH3 interacting domain death agonist isoform X2 [Pseudochaenichthys georgianus]|uniref:BH3 interacting domain death agonist isoform X2 n=1 Tax=Pseudochaenichthys georgianus TaxID=52239 RepID=UPI00146F937D|nr:BH3 interacting domain death agonist isoform X2 [Pseudochaenichthys georgianus]
MDELGDLNSGQNAALLMWVFLQADSSTPEFSKELLSLGKELNFSRDINFNRPCEEDLDDGDLETDGHLPISAALQDILPSVELQWPMGRAQAADCQQLAEELREIADQLQQNVVNQATQNLSRNMSNTPSAWTEHLSREVQSVMQSVGLHHLSRERVMLALTLTLVKGVCALAPQLLRSLFVTALQFLNPARATEEMTERHTEDS